MAEFLLLFFSYIFHDIFYAAIQDSAECFYGVGADALVPLQSGDLGRAYFIFFDQRVLTYAFGFHSSP